MPWCRSTLRVPLLSPNVSFSLRETTLQSWIRLVRARITFAIPLGISEPSSSRSCALVYPSVSLLSGAKARKLRPILLSRSLPLSLALTLALSLPLRSSINSLVLVRSCGPGTFRSGWRQRIPRRLNALLRGLSRPSVVVRRHICRPCPLASGERNCSCSR